MCFSSSSSCSNETIYQQTKLSFTNIHWQEMFHPPTRQQREEMCFKEQLLRLFIWTEPETDVWLHSVVKRRSFQKSFQSHNVSHLISLIKSLFKPKYKKVIWFQLLKSDNLLLSDCRWRFFWFLSVSAPFVEHFKKIFLKKSSLFHNLRWESRWVFSILQVVVFYVTPSVSNTDRLIQKWRRVRTRAKSWCSGWGWSHFKNIFTLNN